MRPEDVCQFHLPCQGEHHGLLLNAQEAAVCHGAGRRCAGRLASDGIFADKIPSTQYVEDRFSPGLGSDAEFYLSFLNDKQGISCIPLSINGLSLSESHHAPTIADGGEKGHRTESTSLLCHYSP